MGANRELPALGARLLNHGDAAAAARRADTGRKGALAGRGDAADERESRSRGSRLLPALVSCGVLASALVLGVPLHTAQTARTVQSAASVVAAAAQSSSWSAPATLGACPAGAHAWVVFPSDSPSHATGAGAIVWSASARCPGGEGARIAPLGAGDAPAQSAVPRTSAGRALAPYGPLLASGAPRGQIAIAGSAPGAAAAGMVIQGAATGPFSTLPAPEGSRSPMALTTAYLGDLALAAPPALSSGRPARAVRPARGAGRDAGLRVHVERFYDPHGFARDGFAGSAGGGPVQAPAIALDYRSEALAVWAQAGAIYARLLPAQGAPGPIQRLARGARDPQITAVLSDDEHGIVAWSERRGDETAVYLDRSAVGVRFGAAELVERFRDPDGLLAPAASPRLVRLSSESVMLAWAGEAGGRWVVRTAPVDLDRLGPASTIAAPGGDALLAGLAPGPHGEALVLWTEPQDEGAGRVELARQALFAARGYDAYPGETYFGEAEQIAPPAPVAGASAAFDPDSGRAVAVWRGQGGAIEYSIRAAGPPR
ncbi:MAG TPA: hypothetical protein VMF09_06485 [Solirubrobacteraceae bacterium]|nr:hypothetical protein [Solirubrobacteraceae bacterium]